MMPEIVALRPKTYNCLADDNNEHEKAKLTEQWVIKQKCKFEDYKNCLEANQLDSKINHPEKMILE